MMTLIAETQCESQKYDLQCSTCTARDDEETCDLLLTYSQPSEKMHFFAASVLKITECTKYTE